ncbi:hypothetical protein AAC387_Pa05g0607 [Persea americana]
MLEESPGISEESRGIFLIDAVGLNSLIFRSSSYKVEKLFLGIEAAGEIYIARTWSGSTHFFPLILVFTEMMVGTMTELKRRHESLDHSSGICNTVKRHKTQGSISMRERKEKLGEKIAALQQLVSPFGKTDTASVLLEAMGYIKFLQEQVQVLSAPYLQSEPSGKLQELEYYSLQRRGLCLVPITWTIKVVRSNGADIWAPVMKNTPK